MKSLRHIYKHQCCYCKKGDPDELLNVLPCHATSINVSSMELTFQEEYKMNQGTKNVKRSCRFFLLDYVINFRVPNLPLLHISKTQTHFWLEYHWKQQSPKTPHSVRGAFEIRVLWVLLKRLGRWRCYGWVPPKSFQYDF